MGKAEQLEEIEVLQSIFSEELTGRFKSGSYLFIIYFFIFSFWKKKKNQKEDRRKEDAPIFFLLLLSGYPFMFV